MEPVRTYTVYTHWFSGSDDADCSVVVTAAAAAASRDAGAAYA
jgi:hypothetical protein